MAKTVAQWHKDRLPYVSELKKDKTLFHFFPVKLDYVSAAGTPETVTVRVSNPVIVNGIYVPVTAKETFDIAGMYGWLPLTRAVMDKAHNTAVQIPFKAQGDLLDYETYSVTLSKFYGSHDTSDLVSGAHKLWVLSAFHNKAAVNYGFYKKDPTPSPLSPSLKGWSVIQSLGSRHNDQHWDYSQLLQLMRLDPEDPPFTVDGKTYTLSQAVAAGLSAVWDESSKLDPKILPTAP